MSARLFAGIIISSCFSYLDFNMRIFGELWHGFTQFLEVLFGWPFLDNLSGITCLGGFDSKVYFRKEYFNLLFSFQCHKCEQAGKLLRTLW